MTIRVPLGRGLCTLVDEEDAPLLQETWWAIPGRGAVYVGRTEGRGKDRIYVWLHRRIAGAVQGEEVDHINGDTLNNRRCNLRVATHAENMQNRRVSKNSSTGIRGVRFDPKRNRYLARVKVGGKYRYARRFATLEEANAAVRAARISLMTHANEQRTTRPSR